MEEIPRYRTSYSLNRPLGHPCYLDIRTINTNSYCEYSSAALPPTSGREHSRQYRSSAPAGESPFVELISSLDINNHHHHVSGSPPRHLIETRRELPILWLHDTSPEEACARPVCMDYGSGRCYHSNLLHRWSIHEGTGVEKGEIGERVDRMDIDFRAPSSWR